MIKQTIGPSSHKPFLPTWGKKSNIFWGSVFFNSCDFRVDCKIAFVYTEFEMVPNVWNIRLLCILQNLRSSYFTLNWAHWIYYSDTDQLPAVYSSIITILWKYMVYKPYTSHIPSNYKYQLIYNIGDAPTLYYHIDIFYLYWYIFYYVNYILYNYLLIRLGISANTTLQKPKGFPIIVESPPKESHQLSIAH